MRIEDSINTDFLSNEEKILTLAICSICTATALLMGGALSWYCHFLGVFCFCGLFLFATFVKQEQKYNNILPFVLFCLPAIYSLIIAFIAMGNPATNSFLNNQENYIVLNEPNGLPTSFSSMSFFTNTIFQIGIYTLGVSLFFVINSRYTLRIIFVCMGVISVFLSLIGFLFYFAGSTKILFITPADEKFFSIFSTGIHWAQFALIWCIVLSFINISYLQIFSKYLFFSSNKFYLMIASFILAFSIILSGTYLQSAIALLAMSVSFLINGIFSITNFKSEQFQIYKQEGNRKLMKKPTPSKKRIFFILYILISTFLLIGSLINFKLSLSNNFDRNEPSFLTENLKENIKQDALLAYEANPNFGWSDGSFKDIMAFYGQIDLGSSPISSVHSDFIENLVEKGYIGVFVWAISITLISLIVLVLRPYSISGICMILFILASLLPCLNNAIFVCPAVCVSFWIAFFGSLAWKNASMK